MKFGITCGVAIVLLANIAVADLQGPQVTSGELLDSTDSSTKPASNEETTADVNVEDSNETQNNQRKSAKYIDDQMTAAKNAAQIASAIQPADGESKNKLLQFAIFERLWNEEVVRKKLQEQIETIEAKREPIETVDPTQEEIEGCKFKKLKEFF